MTNQIIAIGGTEFEREGEGSSLVLEKNDIENCCGDQEVTYRVFFMYGPKVIQ